MARVHFVLFRVIWWIVSSFRLVAASAAHHNLWMSANTPIHYSDIFDALERNSVPYVVVSGIAVVLHGHIRPVFDLDMVIPETPDEQNRAMQTLMHSGFVPSIPIPLNFLTVLRMFDHSEREIDVFVKYHIPFNELWASSERIRVGDHMARVASLEHLLRAKRITGRPHDLMDVEALLALNR